MFIIIIYIMSAHIFHIYLYLLDNYFNGILFFSIQIIKNQQDDSSVSLVNDAFSND